MTDNFSGNSAVIEGLLRPVALRPHLSMSLLLSTLTIPPSCPSAKQTCVILVARHKLAKFMLIAVDIAAIQPMENRISDTVVCMLRLENQAKQSPIKT